MTVCRKKMVKIRPRDTETDLHLLYKKKKKEHQDIMEKAVFLCCKGKRHFVMKKNSKERTAQIVCIFIWVEKPKIIRFRPGINSS